MYILNFVLATLAVASAGPVTEQPYKDQYCMDPRTMRKHAAYTEWADAYSCTRHRCQPGGRNLAIYTVGCKRVEAPESAIECEEVVEDTNMQFPFCCTRLRCLVVVRGEVWTRVLGQPWETLPAAPWSHMYKMKKPPPANGTLKSPDETNEKLPWTPGEGPVYELQTKGHNEEEKVLRSNKKQTTEGPDCNDVAPRAAPVPDIVIALSTGNDQKEPSGLRVAEHKDHKSESRHKRNRKSTTKFPQFIDDEPQENVEIQEQEELGVTDKPMEPMSREDESNSKYYANAYGVTQKVPNIQHHQSSWTEIPQSQWNEHEPMTDTEPLIARSLPQKKMEEKPENLQAMVDAIGTKMKDIETAVQKMSERVYMEKPVTNDADFGSAEKNGLSLRSQPDPVLPPHKHHEPKDHSKEQPEHKMKKPGTDTENYKRFTVRNYATKYLHGSTDGSTEPPLFVEDGGMNGYFSDASNSVVRRATPKEPAATYMAPVDNRRKAPAHITIVSDISEEVEKKRKKHSHKKKRTKGHHKKHHTKDEKRKRFNRINSVELDRNAVSLEDSSAGNTGA